MMAEGGSHSIIQFEGLNLPYGNEPKALKDMTFVLKLGSFHFLTRPRRTGKTLLLRFMYHLTMRPNRPSGSNLWIVSILAARCAPADSSNGWSSPGQWLLPADCG